MALPCDRMSRGGVGCLGWLAGALAIGWGSALAEPPVGELTGAPAVVAARATSPGAEAAAAPAEPMPALLLAREMPPGLSPVGFLVSEKFDGVRALWDGQRLRTRRGTLLNAPAWFLARLPAGVALDGELWLGRGRFDEVSALLRRQATTDEDWRALRYLVFELPGGAGSFEARVGQLQALAARLDWPQLVVVQQVPLADATQLQARLQAVVRQGGEGLMLHRADAPYRSGRSDDLYKLKLAQDAEATVIGYTPGRGRHLGRVGALRVRNEAGNEFLVGSGLSDAERATPPALGSTITYTHRGETRRGLPRFATFLRVREEP